MAYRAIINAQGNNVSPQYYRLAAAAWAQAGMKDSAFQLLENFSGSGNLHKWDVVQVQNGLAFSSLYTDKRWRPVLEKMKNQAEKNGYAQEEIIYGRKDGMALTLVKVSPKVKPNGKGIIYVISGSWISGYNGIEMPTGAAEQFLNKGYTMFAVVHGSAPRFAIPDAVSDIQRAVRFIRYNASTFGIDPDKIGITGTSAGGHLSLAIAMSDDSKDPLAEDPVDRASSRVQAVAVLFPPTDLLNWGGPGMNMVNAIPLLKAAKSWGFADFRVYSEKSRTYEEVTDTAMRNAIGKVISPIYAVSPDDPPVFIIHGDADPTVPLQQSESFIARLKENGIPNRFILKKGGKHNGDDMKPEWLEFVDWFDKYLK